MQESLPRYRKTIQIGYRSVIQDGRISPALLWEELEEAAEEHCRMVGMDIFTLLNRGEAWILKAGDSRIKRYPVYDEKITIETWISSLDRYKGQREYLLRDKKGEVLGEISTLWVYLDLKRRTLKAIPEEFHIGWGSQGHPLHRGFGRKSKFIPAENYGTASFRVRRRDMDSSAHVHNIRYLEWLCESIPEEIYHKCQISGFTVFYRKEMRTAGTVDIRSENLGGGQFRHDYYDRGSSIMLCSARSFWTEKIYPENHSFPVSIPAAI
ncbi:MAG: thioesterase [Spirochaetales bacterium]|nr:thioesterase [Spirochaetales bacterium]